MWVKSAFSIQWLALTKADDNFPTLRRIDHLDCSSSARRLLLPNWFFLLSHFSASIHVPEILIFFGTCRTLEEDIHFHRIAFHNLTHFPHQIEQNLLSTSYWTIFHNSSIYTFHLHQIAPKLSKNIIFQGTLPFFCDKSWPKQEGWLRWEKKLNVWQVPA